MKYRYLNEVLLNWGDSDENIQDNSIIKSSDIKKKISGCFIYKIEDKPSRIKIFDDGTRNGWPEFKKYKDKVYINGKHIELDNEGWTIDKFDPGEYRVYIEDIDQVTNCQCMFYECKQLVSAFIPNSVTSIGNAAFADCTGLTSVTIPNSVTFIGDGTFWNCNNLKTVYVEDINKFNQIKFGNEFSNPLCYGAKLIEI